MVFILFVGIVRVCIDIGIIAPGMKAHNEYCVVLSWRGATTGRLFLIASMDLHRNPRETVRPDFGTSQIFGVDVFNAGTGAFPSKGSVGFPFASLSSLPPGNALVQGVLVPYERYDRKDGHSLWLPAWNTFTYSHDQDDYGWTDAKHEFGAGGILTAEGVVFSKPTQVSLPLQSDLKLTLEEQETPYPSRPAETENMKHISIRSKCLSEFWGRDVNVSAWVLLPAGFHEHPEARFPLIVNTGHYSYQAFRGWSALAPDYVTPPSTKTGNPDDCHYCSTTACDDCDMSDSFDQLYAFYFARNWSSVDTESVFHKQRVLLVRLQTQNPFFDDSYMVNSANLGPYGDAVTFELIPEIEQRYRGLGKWARGLYGGSTGGWEAIGAQVMYPDEYNGCVANAPDPVDFRALQVINIYNQTNGFRKESQLHLGSLPFKRSYKGEALSTVEQVARYEQVLGGWRSGGQLTAWFAVWGPVGQDGYPKPLWNLTGEIDAEVAAYWRQNYDISAILDKQWEVGLGRKLQGKLKVFVGAMDAFYLNDAVYLLEHTLTGRAPDADAEFRYGTSRGRGYSHAWSGSNETSMRAVDLTLHQRLIPLLVDGFLRRAPQGADVTSWRY